MYEPLLDAGAEILLVLGYAVGTVALSLLGLAAEYNSFQQFTSGHQVLTVWFAAMGVVALAFAAKLGREKLLPRVATRR